MLTGYVAIGREFVNSANRKLFVSFPFQLVFHIHTNIIVISSFTLYTLPYLQYNKRKCVYDKCKEMMDLVKCYQWKIGVDIRKYLVLFIIKTVVTDTFTFLAIWTNWRLIGAGNIKEFYLLAFTFLPIAIVRFYTNLFYGGVLCMEATFKQLNKNLNDFVRDSKLFQSYAGFSKDLDKLSIFHFKLIQATNAFSSVFSFQIVLSLLSMVIILVLRCFYQYVAIVGVITRTDTAAIYRCIFMCVAILMSLYDLYSTSDACQSLEKQARMESMSAG